METRDHANDQRVWARADLRRQSRLRLRIGLERFGVEAVGNEDSLLGGVPQTLMLSGALSSTVHDRGWKARQQPFQADHHPDPGLLFLQRARRVMDPPD